MLFIFDWDGTLADSVTRIVAAMTVAIAEVGLPERDPATIRNIVGLGLPEAIRALYPAEQEAALTLLQRAYSASFVAADATGSPLFPGAREMLETLKASGWSLAVATSKSRKGLSRALQSSGMEGFFDATRCADETRSKPHPLMLHELLAELSVTPAAAVMVGDTEYDMAMARTAGVHRIGVTFGAHSAERLLPYEPALIVERLADLRDWCLPDAAVRRAI